MFTAQHGHNASDEGHVWKIARKTASLIFTKKNFTELMEQTFVHKGKQLLSILEAEPPGKAVDMQGYFFNFTMDSIMKLPGSISQRLLAIICFSVLFIIGTPAPKATAQYDDTYVSFNDFYDNLAPYGQWIEDPQYGYVWSPNEDANFRPYYTNGYWVMTDYGNTCTGIPSRLQIARTCFVAE